MCEGGGGGGGDREGRKEMFSLTTHTQHISFTVIWRRVVVCVCVCVCGGGGGMLLQHIYKFGVISSIYFRI